jgi:Zn-dependent M16 (insulinase) family peptidase
MSEMSQGLTQTAEWTRIVQAGEFDTFAAKLTGLVEKVIRKGRMRICAHVSSPDQQERVIEKFTGFVREFNGDRPSAPFPVPDSLKAKVAESARVRKVFLQAKTSSNHCFQAVTIGSYLAPESPVLNCLAEVLDREFLYDLIRVDLGAYGLMVRYDGHSGIFSLQSYHDQNAPGVLAAFAKALRLAAAGDKITDEVTENAIIVTFSQLDQPEPPQNRGVIVWQGTPIEILRRRRHIYYDITKEQLREAAKALSVLEPVTVVYSSEDLAPAPDGFEVIDLQAKLNQSAQTAEEDADEGDEE